MKNDLLLHTNGSPVDLAIAAWIHAKANRSGSAKTRAAYISGIESFRTFTLNHGLDLDGNQMGKQCSDELHGDARAALALLAQLWADQGQPSPATFNQRLAILSSFYKYANTYGLLSIENPIARVERRRVDAYGGAQPLSYELIAARIAAIDSTTLVGARNRALLMVGLQCGRRRSELANLRWRDVQIRDTVITLHWRQTKGGKTMYDTLPRPVANALLQWLQLFYGPRWATLPPDAPIWVSLSPNDSWGQALDTQSLGDICKRHLGTSKVHTLRHTFAKAMEDAGAKVSEIQQRLGHASLQTTGLYLNKLNAATNIRAADLATLFGFDAGTE